MFIESPSPLSVIAVAKRAIAHGGIADEKEHGVVAVARAAGGNACCLCFVEAVERKVDDMVDILQGSRHTVLCHEGQGR